MTKYDDRFSVVHGALEIIQTKAGNAENGYDWNRKMSVKEIRDWMIKKTEERNARCKITCAEWGYEYVPDVIPTMADVVIGLKVLEMACEVEGSLGEGYGIHSMQDKMANYDLWILNEDDLYELEWALDGYEARFGSIRDWLNAKAPKMMKKLESRKAKAEAKLAKCEAKRKAEERADWEQWKKEIAAEMAA